MVHVDVGMYEVIQLIDTLQRGFKLGSLSYPEYLKYTQQILLTLLNYSASQRPELLQYVIDWCMA